MPYIALAIGIVLAGLDQLFKYLIVSHFELNQTQVLIPNILNLTYIRNEGVAFGIVISFATWSHPFSVPRGTSLPPSSQSDMMPSV